MSNPILIQIPTIPATDQVAAPDPDREDIFEDIFQKKLVIRPRLEDYFSSSKARPIPPRENGLGLNGDGKDWKLRSVYRLAEEHCANFCRGGPCEGADVDLKTGRHYRWRPAGGVCLLALDLRCPYFEQCVLPMEERREKDWPSIAQVVAFRKAARLYHDTFSETVPPSVVGQEIRKCPDCGKGSVEPRNRYCSACRIRRRKATNAANQRNWQKKRLHPNTVKQNGSSLGAASQGTLSDARYPLSGHLNFEGQTVLRQEVA